MQPKKISIYLYRNRYLKCTHNGMLVTIIMTFYHFCFSHMSTEDERLTLIMNDLTCMLNFQHANIVMQFLWIMDNSNSITCDMSFES